MVAGHSKHFTPGGYLSAVIHITLAGIEPTTLQPLPVGLPGYLILLVNSVTLFLSASRTMHQVCLTVVTSQTLLYFSSYWHNERVQ